MNKDERTGFVELFVVALVCIIVALLIVATFRQHKYQHQTMPPVQASESA